MLSGNCSTCFGWYLHPSSGAKTTVSTASGICYTVTATCRYSAPDYGWWYHPKHAEQFPYKINCVTLHLVGYILEYSNYCSQLHCTRALAFSDVDGKGKHVPYYDSDFTQHIIINTKKKKSFNRYCSYVIHASFNPITLPTAGAQTSIQRLDSYHYPISPPHSKWVTCSMQSSSQKSIPLVYGSHPSRFAPLRVKTIVHRYSKKNTNKHVPEC